MEKGNEVFARFPYVIRKRFGFTIIEQPQLTQYLGPWFKDIPGTKYSKRLAREKTLVHDLLSQLPSFDYFSQNFSPSITNWLPWYWDDFSQTTNYTYRLNSTLDLNLLWQSMESKIRTDIRKARKIGINISTTENLNTFWNVHCKTFERQGLSPPYSFDFVKNLDTALKIRDRRKILVAEDENGAAHAVVYLIWNDDCVWYLMGGGDSDLRNSGATSLAIWDAIGFALEQGKSFDFEGSMREPIERFFRGFGAVQVPYFKISKYNSRILELRNSFKSIF